MISKSERSFLSKTDKKRKEIVMKASKRILSLLLVLMLALSLSVTAFAAETGSITVDNPVAGETYTAYKIFDVSYNVEKTAYSYTIQGDSEWFETVNAYTNGLTLTQVTGTNTYVVTTTDAFSAPAFAIALKAAVAGKTGTTLTVQDGKATAAGLELGYYFVSSTNGALCNLTTTNPSVTIHDKNDIPFDKVDDKESVDVGETVTYTITGKVPDATGFTSYIYKFTDTMSEGLTFQKDIVVKIGDTDVTGACTIIYTPSEDAATGFELTIPVMDYQEQVGAAITVTYTAIVNEHAVATVEHNKATLTYSNDPTDYTKTTETPEDKETVYSAKIVIDKYAANTENPEDHSKKLEGAQFVLYKEVEGVKQYYKWNNETKVVEWVADKKDATVKTTDENGAASFDGVANGTYYLEEIAAPAGYNLLKDPVAVTVDGAKAIAAEADTSVLTPVAAIANNTGAVLPSTGGIGTTIFYVLGGLLVAGAAILLVTKKRMSNAK